MAKKPNIVIADILAITDDQILTLQREAINQIVDNDIDAREWRIPQAVMIIGLIKRLEQAEKRVGFL